MKTHTNNYKNQIKKFGRELNSKIIYGNTELGSADLNSVTPRFQSSLLKSAMKQLDVDSNIEIPVNIIINYQLGLKVGNAYEYLDFGNYVVSKVEKQEDTNSYKLTCYDKMLYAMKPYESLGITYPITVRNYLIALCTKIGLTFANASDTFPNYNQSILEELYLDSNGNSLGYTYRDVFDELSQVTGSVICINNNDEVEVRYPNTTNDTIDEEYLKDVNVNFGEKFGPVNSIVFTRAGGSDSVYLQDQQSITLNGLCEIKIEDNQILNLNNRADFLPDLLTQLDGLEYYYNDYSSTGITYYDILDKYNVTIGEITYNCIMFNDEINITQGLEENVYTEVAEETETEYQYASKDDRTINQAYIIAKKNDAEIQALASKVVDLSNTINGVGSITLENAYEGILHRLEISGSILLLYPSNTLYPNDSLTILDTYLIVDNNKYHLDIDKLNYVSASEHDTFIYEDGKCWIERIDGTIETKEDINITVLEDSTISLEQYSNAIFKCIYLLQNEYTDTFTNSLDIVSKINMSPEKIEINSNKISLAGKTIDLTSEVININSKYFNVDSQGNLIATSAKLNGKFENHDKNGNLAILISNTNIYFYDYGNSGARVGGICSTRGTQDNVTGMSVYTMQGSRIIIGYKESEESSSIKSIISYDTNDLTKTPWITNTVNGTMFPSCGDGVIIQNGLIKHWDLDTKSGTITINEPDNHSTTITVKSGLITNWEYQ